MPNHFDVQAARTNPRLNICDLYLFPGAPGRTTMVMTTSADVGLSSVDVLHPQGLYTFRFDLNGDEHEDVVFTFRFGEPQHEKCARRAHVQSFQVSMASTPSSGTDGCALLSGQTGKIARSRHVSAFVGVVPEMFAADNRIFRSWPKALVKEGPTDRPPCTRRLNRYRNRNVMGTVLEVPDTMLGAMPMRAWATISLADHGTAVQVCRAAYPLFTHLLPRGADANGLVDQYHASTPDRDRRVFAGAISTFVEHLSATAGWVADPQSHGWRVANLLCPSMIPYQVGVLSVFETGAMNGRPLAADAFDTMISLAMGRSIVDGVVPPAERLIGRFPYYGPPFTAEEQIDVVPLKEMMGMVSEARTTLGEQHA